METATLTIRNIPRPVLERLKARAAERHRSLQGELLEILEVASLETGPRLTAAGLRNRVRAMGLESAADSTAMIRADRDGPGR